MVSLSNHARQSVQQSTKFIEKGRISALFVFRKNLPAQLVKANFS